VVVNKMTAASLRFEVFEKRIKTKFVNDIDFLLSFVTQGL